MPKNCGSVCFGQQACEGGEIATMFVPPTDALVGTAGAAGAAGAAGGAAQPGSAAISSNEASTAARKMRMIRHAEAFGPAVKAGAIATGRKNGKLYSAYRHARRQ